MMRVNWVFAKNYQLDPTTDIEKIKSVGPSWGAWQTWRGCATDNVVCHDFARSKELISRAFHAVCNFYMPKSHYKDLGRPVGVKLYDSENNLEADDVEDIVAMHLASKNCDLILLAGFDLSIPKIKDKYEAHKLKNRHGMIRSVIAQNPEIQWVLVDSTTTPDSAYTELSNFTCDQMDNVIQLLV